jgi:ATP/maltotriose-dependent transcriptional regulator MalT
MSAAWISLDEGDNDPVRFWDYIIAALVKGVIEKFWSVPNK